MKIRIADLGSTPRVFSHAWPPAWVSEAINDPGTFSGFSPCEATVEASLIDRTVVCRGRIECRATGRCARCLTETAVDLGGPLDLVFEPRRATAGHGAEDEMDLGCAFYERDEVDLEEHIRQLVVMNVPMRFLCREDCKGLCDRCGRNLNDGPCFCPPL